MHIELSQIIDHFGIPIDFTFAQKMTIRVNNIHI